MEPTTRKSEKDLLVVKKQEEPSLMDLCRAYLRLVEEDKAKKQREQEVMASEDSNQIVTHVGESLRNIDQILDQIQRSSEEKKPEGEEIQSAEEIDCDVGGSLKRFEQKLDQKQPITAPEVTVPEVTAPEVTAQEVTKVIEEEDPIVSWENLFQGKQSDEHQGKNVERLEPACQVFDQMIVRGKRVRKKKRWKKLTLRRTNVLAVAGNPEIRKKHLKTSVVMGSNLRATASSTKSFLGIHTVRMKEQSNFDKKVSRRDLIFQPHVLHGPANGASEQRARGNMFMIGRRESGTGCSNFSNFLSAFELVCRPMFEWSDGAEAARYEVEVWEPGGSLSPKVQSSKFDGVGNVQLLKKSVAGTGAYLGVKFGKLDFMEQLMVVGDHGYEVKELAKVLGSDAGFINIVFDPGKAYVNGLQEYSVVVIMQAQIGEQETNYKVCEFQEELVSYAMCLLASLGDQSDRLKATYGRTSMEETKSACQMSGNENLLVTTRYQKGRYLLSFNFMAFVEGKTHVKKHNRNKGDAIEGSKRELPAVASGHKLVNLLVPEMSLQLRKPLLLHLEDMVYFPRGSKGIGRRVMSEVVKKNLRGQEIKQMLFGLDMGGTPMDVSCSKGVCEQVIETQIAGTIIQAQRLDINTAAASGGDRPVIELDKISHGIDSGNQEPWKRAETLYLASGVYASNKIHRSFDPGGEVLCISNSEDKVLVKVYVEEGVDESARLVYAKRRKKLKDDDVIAVKEAEAKFRAELHHGTYKKSEASLYEQNQSLAEIYKFLVKYVESMSYLLVPILSFGKLHSPRPPESLFSFVCVSQLRVY